MTRSGVLDETARLLAVIDIERRTPRAVKTNVKLHAVDAPIYGLGRINHIMWQTTLSQTFVVTKQAEHAHVATQMAVLCFLP